MSAAIYQALARHTNLLLATWFHIGWVEVVLSVMEAQAVTDLTLLDLFSRSDCDMRNCWPVCVQEISRQ